MKIMHGNLDKEMDSIINIIMDSVDPYGMFMHVEDVFQKRMEETRKVLIHRKEFLLDRVILEMEQEKRLVVDSPGNKDGMLSVKTVRV